MRRASQTFLKTASSLQKSPSLFRTLPIVTESFLTTKSPLAGSAITSTQSFSKPLITQKSFLSTSSTASQQAKPETFSKYYQDKAKPNYYLDGQENLGVKIQIDQANQEIKIQIGSEYKKEEKNRFIKNILKLMSFEGQDIEVAQKDGEFTIKYKTPFPPEINLKINGHKFASFNFLGDFVMASKARELTASEMRFIGRSEQTIVPMPLNDTVAREDRPVTDIHSHLSGQIFAKDLVGIGVNHEILYPVSMLRELGINYPKPDAYPEGKYPQVKKYVFIATAHLQKASDSSTEDAVPLSDLSPEDIKKLEKSLSLSPEKQCTFEELERVYFYRQPFTKNLKLLPDILRKIAEGYKARGIEYAELSSNEVIDPEWLRVIHWAMPNIEKDTGVKIRFLAGLPRNLDEVKLGQKVDAMKVALLSPYVIGPDILGYEMNKTSDISKHLEDLVVWAKANKQEIVVRVHAGENSKNPRNVKQCLEFAKKHEVPVRIGHSIYGVDEETIKLAQELSKAGLLIIEFNPDSNIALNNVDFYHNIEISKFAKSGIGCVIGGDGDGLYGSDPRKTAIFCGATGEDFKHIRSTEEAYMQKQQEIFDRKQESLPEDFFEKLKVAFQTPSPSPKVVAVEKVGEVKTIPIEQAHFAGMTPILVAGSQGSAWNDDVTNKFAVRKSIKNMLETLDPSKVYFVTGRIKESGIGAELLSEIQYYNRHHEDKFKSVVMVAEGRSNAPLHPVDKRVKLEGPLVFVPGQLTSYVKEHNGLAVFFGGKSITREMISEAEAKNVPFVLAKDCAGASAEKSLVYQAQSCSTADVPKHMLGLLKQTYPSEFPSQPDGVKMVKALSTILSS